MKNTPVSPTLPMYVGVGYAQKYKAIFVQSIDKSLSRTYSMLYAGEGGVN